MLSITDKKADTDDVNEILYDIKMISATREMRGKRSRIHQIFAMFFSACFLKLHKNYFKEDNSEFLKTFVFNLVESFEVGLI